MPTYRRARLVGDAIRSLLAQDTPELELIVMDDCSGDDTPGVVEAFTDARLRYHRNERNLGVPGNVNRGLSLSRGRYVLIFHDSDIARPDLLGKMLTLIRERPSLAYVHCGLEFVDAQGRTERRSVGGYNRVTGGLVWLERMLTKLDSEVSAIILTRRDTYERWGVYDDRFGFYADIEWSMRMCRHGDVGYVAEPLVVMRPRETYHPFARLRWETFEWLAAMRDQHMAALPGLRRRARARLKYRLALERHLARAVAACVVKKDPETLRSGARTVAARGGPMARTAWWLGTGVLRLAPGPESG